jgi:hypothetical protein
MSFELSVLVVLTVAGIIGGCSASRFTASGKAALALGVVPVAGLGLSIAFC